MSDFNTFTPEQLTHHDEVVESNLRLHLAKEIEALVNGDDLLARLLQLDTPMAEGARMALDIAAEIVRGDGG